MANACNNVLYIIIIIVLRYPRESAFTGAESTLVRFPQNIKYQQHITSDIGYAVRQHFFASHNLEWMKEIGCDIAMGTAEFWASRVTFNESTNRFDIAGIMGPDEDHWNVTNNAYTNVGAALNLYFGSYVITFVGVIQNVIFVFQFSDTLHVFAIN